MHLDCIYRVPTWHSLAHCTALLCSILPLFWEVPLCRYLLRTTDPSLTLVYSARAPIYFSLALSILSLLLEGILMAALEENIYLTRNISVHDIFDRQKYPESSQTTANWMDTTTFSHSCVQPLQVWLIMSDVSPLSFLSLNIQSSPIFTERHTHDRLALRSVPD